MMGGDMGFGGFAVAFVVLLCLLPFGLWQLAELVIWLFTNVRVTW